MEAANAVGFGQAWLASPVCMVP